MSPFARTATRHNASVRQDWGTGGGARRPTPRAEIIRLFCTFGNGTMFCSPTSFSKEASDDDGNGECQIKEFFFALGLWTRLVELKACCSRRSASSNLPANNNFVASASYVTRQAATL